MKKPSEYALDLAEEVFDHVRYGLTRADAIHELAEMIDEHTAKLLQSIQGLINDATRHGGAPGRNTVTDLKTTMREYQPVRPPNGHQPEYVNGQRMLVNLF